ncbi:hypothetical protein PNOK_0488900 [Pyrrhoderma noxium]|uniref:Uncharacterized protein n=1 Tax=Pyrrhoderma noxium TaxID=2282107 RepID=A0A286UKF7_9AGAM|nr:hypothetical protein PNOK_0488900 [Pyrrhoderma noxium]
MSEPSGSGPPKTGPPLPSKAIGNLATTTRGGSAKMKFVPTLPVRRKKEEPKPDPKAEPSSSTDSGPNRGPGRGRGRGRGLGRGEGRGGGGAGSKASSRAPPQEMVASGPFALGPAMGGKSGGWSGSGGGLGGGGRSTPRSNFSPIVPMGGPGGRSSTSLGAGLTSSEAPSLFKREVRDGQEDGDEGEGGDGDVKMKTEDAYSDPEDGVEIIDIDDVRRMDWMAPESLAKERNGDKKRKKNKNKNKKVKGEVGDERDKGKVKVEPEEIDISTPEVPDQVDAANALDLSESEEEEELEDIINDFTLQEEEMVDTDLNVRQEKLYFFQFPEPFPTFYAPTPPPPPPPASTQTQIQIQSMDVDGDETTPGLGPDKANKKTVSFAPDVKASSSASVSGSGIGTGTVSPAEEGKKDEEAEAPLDGIIGQLEIHRSGAVRMRLENGILLDVTAATQPSFLQHAIYINIDNTNTNAENGNNNEKRMCVLGEVNRRFNVSPNVDALLEALERADLEEEVRAQAKKEEEARGALGTLGEGAVKREGERGVGGAGAGGARRSNAGAGAKGKGKEREGAGTGTGTGVKSRKKK